MQTIRKTASTTTLTEAIAPLGEVNFVRTRRTKRLSISVRPFKPVRVAVPWGMPFPTGRQFLMQNVDWIRRQQTKAKHIEDEHRSTIDGRRRINKAAARRQIVERLEQLAREHGFRYNRVAIRNQKTRWGSCSEKNNINLNINLVRLKPELMDYVILHELVHLRIKDHSRRFWAELDKHVGGSAKALDGRLKKHMLGL